MNLLLKWFERMARNPQEARLRRVMVQEIFATRGTDVSALQKPACWRRKARAGTMQRAL